MNEPKDVNVNTDSTKENGYVDPRTVEAEVLGELRKTKIGKPLMVIELLGLFVLALISLPIIQGMLEDENSTLYKILKGGATLTPTVTTKAEEFLDGSVQQSLSSSTAIKFENIVMKNFRLAEGKMDCIMYSYNGVINLDEGEYYLEIYSNNQEFLNYIKLTGQYDYQEKEVSFTSENLSFNTTMNYFAKIKKMEDADYPDLKLTTDESGLGGFTCTKGNHVIDYTFLNNYLVRIKDTERVLISDFKDNNQAYVNQLEAFRNKALKLPEIATVEEVTDGFLYTADIDLEAPGFVIPSDLGDYNYYPQDTQAKVIHYAMRGKGFDCE